jgi:hypothetical protein
LVVHNKDAKQETVKTHGQAGDRWYSDFNSPDFDSILFTETWLVKTKNEGVKIKNNDIALNGKSTKLKQKCFSKNPCNCEFVIEL